MVASVRVTVLRKMLRRRQPRSGLGLGFLLVIVRPRAGFRRRGWVKWVKPVKEEDKS